MSVLQKDERLRRLYMSYTDDGILDIFVGWIVFLAGLMLFTDMVWMAGIYVAIFLPIIWSVKEKTTMPRLRSQELDPATAVRTGKLLVFFLLGLTLTALLGVLAFVLFQNQGFASETRQMMILGTVGLIAAGVLAGFFIVGTVYRAPRWYAYAAVTVAAAVVAWGLSIGLPWVLMAIGAVMALTGTVYLVRFLRSHPVLSDKERPNW